MNPIRFCMALALASTPLTSLNSFAQGAAAPAARPPATTPSLQVGQDAKEKAEDAELLQELESNTPKGNIQTRIKGQFSTDKAPRGEGRAGAAPTVQPFRLKNVISHPGSGARTLMVRSTAPEPKDQLTMEEDLAIMSRVLVKAIEEIPGRGNKAKFMGIDVFFTPGGSQLRSLYVENYGALFFLNVNFPLLAPQEKRIEGKAVAGSAWEDARQDLYGQRSQELVGEPSEDYSEEKVDRLKDALLEALKNATNIRGLKSTDFVTLWISGASAANGNIRVVRAGGHGNGGGEPVSVEQLTTPSKRTVLTIRVTKGEIDAYAQGKLNSEAFQKKAMMTAYTGDVGVFAGEPMIWDAGRAGF